MKGVVFTEFLDHVEEHMGAAMAEAIVDDCELSTHGAYTAVGTYPCEEMGALLAALARRSGLPASQLLTGFGARLAETFAAAYPSYFEVPSFFDFVESVDARIHEDVKKLYPDAELPRFATVSRTETVLEIDYSSRRGLQDLARGLLDATAARFGVRASISAETIRLQPEALVRFRIELT